MTTPITHEQAKAVIDRLCSRAEYSPDAIERLTLAAYFEQAELVEKELDELKAKLDGPYDTGPGGDDFTCAKHKWSSLGRCPTCIAEDNARLAAVVKTHGPRLADILAMVLRSEGFRREFGGLDPEEQAAAKALAEVLK